MQKGEKKKRRIELIYYQRIYGTVKPLCFMS